MRLILLALLLTATIGVAVVDHSARAGGGAGASGTLRATPAAFHSHFGLGFGGPHLYRYGSRYRYGYGYRRPGLLHRAIRTAAWLYVLHLFFTHGGLSILLWILVLGFVFSAVRRRRRPPAQPGSGWMSRR
jgi:hypothetical protein